MVGSLSSLSLWSGSSRDSVALVTYVKRLFKSLLGTLGYEIRPLPRSIDTVAARTVKESEYYTRWSAPCTLFTPWAGHPEFIKVYEGVPKHTLVSADRCYILASLGRYASRLPGDFAECGVYREERHCCSLAC